MNISTETAKFCAITKRDYARRREMGQKPLTTAQIVDEICDFVANQQAVFLGGHYIFRAAETGDTGRRWRRLSARAKTLAG
ncbi:hypothetical protein DKG79_24240 (plasmid) [Escherichia fergusonii]|nr:hypothetical protein DKG79_24240 [Escherichia fergusonii]